MQITIPTLNYIKLTIHHFENQEPRTMDKNENNEETNLEVQKMEISKSKEFKGKFIPFKVFHNSFEPYLLISVSDFCDK